MTPAKSKPAKTSVKKKKVDAGLLILLAGGVFFILLIVFYIASQMSLQKPRQPETYVALPGGEEGFFQLKSDNNSPTIGETFTVSILLENNSELDISQDEGIASAEVEVGFDPSQLEAVSADFGSIFTGYNDKIVDNSLGVVSINAFDTQSQPTYPYNSTGRDENQKVFATINFTVINDSPSTTSIVIEDAGVENFFTGIYSNIQGHLQDDIHDQSLAPNNGNLDLTLSSGPTATPDPDASPTPTPTDEPDTPTPTPTDEPDTPTPTSTEHDCNVTGASLEGGDLNDDCVINSVDWGIMWINWTDL